MSRIPNTLSASSTPSAPRPTRRRALGIAAALTASITLAACGGEQEAASSSSAAAESSGPRTLKIGVNPVPHGEILRHVKDNLAADAGLDLEIVEFTDYVQPNAALDAGDLDGNYFQTQPYLDEQEKSGGFDFTAIGPVHVEPLGVYSEKVKDISELTDDSRVAVPNDPANAARSLKLLADKKVVTLADTGDQLPTAQDVESGPEIVELEAAQLPRSLGDVDAAVINGNYAIEADLSPTKDSLALEDAEGSPYANLLVVRSEDTEDPELKKLAELLASEDVKSFISSTYEGTVIPAE